MPAFKIDPICAKPDCNNVVRRSKHGGGSPKRFCSAECQRWWHNWANRQGARLVRMIMREEDNAAIAKAIIDIRRAYREMGDYNPKQKAGGEQ